MTEGRIIVRDRSGRIIGLYSSVEEASKETSISREGILRELAGAHILKGISFEREITNQELREEYRKEREDKWKKEKRNFG